MKELTWFFTLYLQEDYWLGGSLVVMLLILYGNAAFYLIDFYNLIKRKSKAETAAILAIPGTVSVMGAALAAIFVHVPSPGNLGEFALALENIRLNGTLMMTAAVYVLCWAACFVLQKRRRKSEVVRWLVSCIPDACFVLMVCVCFVYRLMVGESLFLKVSEWILWIYLYAVYFLCCKVLLLAMGLLIQLYSIRIVSFRWKEGRNPSVFLFFYYAFFQNAILRNIAAFELGILIPLTMALNQEGWTGEMVGIMASLYACGIFTILFSLLPVMKALNQFRRWGNPRLLKEQFCREYFVEEPVWKNQSYTITRNFLVDTKRPAAFYYWRDLKSVESWHIDKKGNSRKICFYRGECFQIQEDEKEEAAFVFEYARKWQGVNGDAARQAGRPEAQSQGWYQQVVIRLAVMLAFLMMLMVYGRR